ncbi:hypothetical protein, partial [Neisseria animalis]
VLKKGVERVEQYNQMFDLMPGFSLFKALTDNGVSAEAAAVSPSEISAAKYLGAKLAMTVTPTVFQPNYSHLK